MRALEEIDDTFIIRQNDFEEDTRSADEFKEKIINTNLIINKKKQSYQKKKAEPTKS